MIRHLLLLPLIAAVLLTGNLVAAKETLLAKLLRVSGLTANPTALRAPEVEAIGDVWIVASDGGTPSVLTSGGGFRSPVFMADGSLLALKGDAVVRVHQTQRIDPVVSAPGVLRLVGIDAATPREVVVLLDGARPLATLSLDDGKVVVLSFDPKSDAEQAMLGHIRGSDRRVGEVNVEVRTETKRGVSGRSIEWTDVWCRRSSAASQNISRCDGTNCSQPALSFDGRQVAFVKSDR